jgi:hypothetical protein
MSCRARLGYCSWRPPAHLRWQQHQAAGREAVGPSDAPRALPARHADTRDSVATSAFRAGPARPGGLTAKRLVTSYLLGNALCVPVGWRVVQPHARRVDSTLVAPLTWHALGERRHHSRHHSRPATAAPAGRGTAGTAHPSRAPAPATLPRPCRAQSAGAERVRSAPSAVPGRLSPQHLYLYLYLYLQAHEAQPLQPENHPQSHSRPTGNRQPTEHRSPKNVRQKSAPQMAHTAPLLSILREERISV